VNLPVPPGSGEEVWLSLVEYLLVPIGLDYGPERLLISPGFDAHEADPLADCRLDAGEAESAAPDQIVTPRAAARLGQRWAL
jgi:acetoin utilization deacetylase AcuC-like enzyme